MLATPAPRFADFVLYLDLDGVVQHEAVQWHPTRGIHMSTSRAPGRALFEWLPHLRDAIKSLPDLALVLSSSWCVRPGYAKTLRRLPEDLRSRFIGGTFHRGAHGLDPHAREVFLQQTRAAQILADVQRRKPRYWLAIDDDTEEWPTEYADRLVVCDGQTGLSATHVQQDLALKLTTGYAVISASR